MRSIAATRCVAAGAAVLIAAATVGAPSAHAKNGDTHITGTGLSQTIDCRDSVLHVNGNGNQVYALGTCYAVTMQGSGNLVVADNVINDITVYGWDQTVMYKNGDPIIWDRGRELGMTNRINRVPA
ncbi:DUF3060 domain-containing protein [Mycolicibacterium monacense]|uniref:Transmembrane protein n=4 Tax=Mycobacteriaceae TaxID=1762 RepID=A0AAD1J425_MYCMB|nr:membrane protein [Mycolicibacterium monacense DSM 44395]OBB65409.1 hypothetical protein A6B34_23160 [Mycolicibacterium monacense]OBF55805.1 hypothetical protein A5778_08210 [Mycolicibacterium monacense]ORB15516.1 hypothetical protein BST34_21070 [Mycolicibacterium monacense DSM 44395]QHP84821.1 DUF3060 domain-containing protein [Mycolicibacterium monacense DSM 44395]